MTEGMKEESPPKAILHGIIEIRRVYQSYLTPNFVIVYNSNRKAGDLPIIQGLQRELGEFWSERSIVFGHRLLRSSHRIKDTKGQDRPSQ